MVSDISLDTLGGYWSKYRFTERLFLSQNKERRITTRTVDKIFVNVCKEAEITKAALVHTRRNSFSTHWIESDADLRYIQEILGHKSSKTTEIYTHVSTRDIGKIKDPLDTLIISPKRWCEGER